MKVINNVVIFVSLLTGCIDPVKAVELLNPKQVAYVASFVRSYGFECSSPIAAATMEHKEGWVVMCKNPHGSKALIYRVEDNGRGMLTVIVAR